MGEQVEAARNGDVASFGRLYEQYYAVAVGVAYSILGDAHLAEDAAQEAFAVVCRDFGRLRSVDKFPGWLLHFSDYAFNTEVVIPLGPRRIRLVRWFWCAEELAAARGTSAGEAIESARVVMAEDLEICEAVQTNLEAGLYDTGRPGQSPRCTITFPSLTTISTSCTTSML